MFCGVLDALGPPCLTADVSRLHTMNSKTKVVLITGVGLVLAFIVLLPLFYSRDGRQRPYCVNNLRQIEGAKQLWAEENKKNTNDVPSLEDIRALAGAHALKCPQGGSYTIGRVGEPARCSIGGPGHTLP